MHPSQAQQAATIGIATAVMVVLVVLAIASFTGGYVAGRRARFDGGRQGIGVWVLAVVVTVVARIPPEAGPCPGWRPVEVGR